jgi:hypothetical protein
MRKFALFVGLVSLVGSGAAQASTYQDWYTTTYTILTVDFPPTVHSYPGPDLEPGVDTPGAYLYRAAIFHADLTNANLSSANLGGASAGGAWLMGTNLSFADLTCAILTDADLAGADLTGATLTCANLKNTDWSGANLSNANLSGTTLYNATHLGSTTGCPYYDAQTDFTQAWSGGYVVSPLFDPVAACWILVAEPVPSISTHGQIALVLLMTGFATAAIFIRRRAHTPRH